MERPVHHGSEICVAKEQEAYTKLLLEFNNAMTTGSIESFELAREAGIELVTSGVSSEQTIDGTKAILEHLDYHFVDRVGELYLGEEVEPVGYPEDYVFLGDSVELVKNIPDKSIDLIFTDPPYIRDQMHLYRWLAVEADRILKDDGFLMAYVGNIWLDEAMKLMREDMRYFMNYTLIHGGELPYMYSRKTHSATKFILAYTKHGARPVPNKPILSAYQGHGKDKEHHHWGQPTDEAEYYIDAFSMEGDIVLDPFMGGGTTAAACQKLGRKWIGIEIDEEHAATAQRRAYGVGEDI